MREISTVKIYLRYGQQAKSNSFWKKLWGNNLGEMLLKKAKEMDIVQAAIFTARSGYVHGGMITANISEIPSFQNPVCLELVDQQEKLMGYLKQNEILLADTDVVLINDHCYQLVRV